MVELQPDVTVRQVREEDIPEGVSVADAPEAGTQAIRFELEPLPSPPEEDVEPVTPPRLPPPTPPTPRAPEPPAKPAKPEERDVKELEAPRPPEPLIVPVGVPLMVGAGDYLGVVWADGIKDARAQAVFAHGGEADDYIIDLFNDGPRPWFVIRKPILETPNEQEGDAPESANSGLPPNEVKASSSPPLPSSFIIVRCPSDGSEHSISSALKTFKCPIDGVVIDVRENVVSD